MDIFEEICLEVTELSREELIQLYKTSLADKASLAFAVIESMMLLEPMPLPSWETGEEPLKPSPIDIVSITREQYAAIQAIPKALEKLREGINNADRTGKGYGYGYN